MAQRRRFRTPKRARQARFAVALFQHYFQRMLAEPAFIPPAPKPRAKPPSLLRMLFVLYRNPIELWGEPSYNEPWISVSGATGEQMILAHDHAHVTPCL